MIQRITARTIILFGCLTIIFWVATVTPSLLWLYSDGPGSMAREMYQQDIIPEIEAVVPALNLTQEEFVAKVRREFEISIAAGLVVAIIGVVSGVLLIARRRAGRIIAISLCSLVFLRWFISIIRLAIHTSFSPVIFQLVTLPYGIQEQVINPMFFIFTVVLLTRKSVGRQLKNVIVPTPLPFSPSGS